jgi:hypothetical protein
MPHNAITIVELGRVEINIYWHSTWIVRHLTAETAFASRLWGKCPWFIGLPYL